MKLTLTIAALLLSAPFLSYADNGCSLNAGGANTNNIFSGPTTCSKATLSKLSVDGPLTIKKSTIATIMVKGPVTSTDSTITNLTANGTLNLNNTTIEKLTLKGPLEASDSSIFNINVNGPLTFTDSRVGNVIVTDSTASNPGKVYLKGYTTVSGNISFKGGNGIVYQEKGAKIMGEVTGGKIETEK